MFSHFKRKTSNDLVEDMGYNCGWLGLERSNPFDPADPRHKLWEWGYNRAIDELGELGDCPAVYPSNEYEEFV